MVENEQSDNTNEVLVSQIGFAHLLSFSVRSVSYQAPTPRAEKQGSVPRSLKMPSHSEVQSQGK
eukprot:5034268-Amphidinium_carterae.1